MEFDELAEFARKKRLSRVPNSENCKVCQISKSHTNQPISVPEKRSTEIQNQTRSLTRPLPFDHFRPLAFRPIKQNQQKLALPKRIIGSESDQNTHSHCPILDYFGPLLSTSEHTHTRKSSFILFFQSVLTKIVCAEQKKQIL